MAASQSTTRTGTARKPAFARKVAMAATAKRPKPLLIYSHDRGVNDFVHQISEATSMELVDVERRGVQGVFLKDLARSLDLTALRVFDMLGVPKATAEKKVLAGELVSGSGGHAAIGLARLIGKAQDMVANSTAPQASDFDAARWLGRWIETPQPALGGRKPSELLDTPTGLDVVLRLLGALESGAYQ